MKPPEQDGQRRNPGRSRSSAATDECWAVNRCRGCLMRGNPTFPSFSAMPARWRCRHLQDFVLSRLCFLWLFPRTEEHVVLGKASFKPFLFSFKSSLRNQGLSGRMRSHFLLGWVTVSLGSMVETQDCLLGHSRGMWIHQVTRGTLFWAHWAPPAAWA